MAKQLFANNVSVSILEFLSASDMTITVESTSKFPAISGGDWIMATIVPTGGQGTNEVVKITAFSGTSVTVTRAQEGTTAQEFLFGSHLEFRVTKGSLEALRDFTQSGTGAVITTVQNKQREIISDKDFGALADGATDDTAEEQLALNDALANNSEIYYPKGDRRISDTLLITGSFYATLIGTGFSFLRWTGAASKSMLKFIGGVGAPIRKLFIEKLWIHNLNASATATGLEIGETNGQNYGIEISGNTFQGWTAQGALINSLTDEVLWQNNYFNNCAKGAYLKRHAAASLVSNSNHTFIHNYFHECTDYGIDSEHAANTVVFSNQFQQTGAYGARFDRQTTLTFVGNYLELTAANSRGLVVNESNGDGTSGGAQVIEANVFNQPGAGAVGITIGNVGKGVKIGPNQFYDCDTGIKLLSTAPQELTIEPQNFNGVTTEISDLRTYPSRAYQFNIGAKIGATSFGLPTDGNLVVVADGGLMRTVYKVAIPKETWRVAGLTQDVRLCSMPPRARIAAVYADTTEAYAGLAGTIQLQVGTSVGGTELILAYDVKTAAVTKGLADADLGAQTTRAAAVQGSSGTWAGQDIYARLTSSVGNLGNGTITNLSTGMTYVYIIMEVLP